MSKEILFGNEARLKIKAGVDKACSAVAPTLGAVGMSALIEYPGLDPIEADDGVTILKNLEFKDKYENLGLSKLRKAALRTSSEGGDGTATTTVLTQALVSEAFKEIANDSSKIREVRERLAMGLSGALAELSKIKREVTEEDIERIATISSLDPEVAKVIAEAIKEVGVNGVITVEKGAQLGYSKEVVKGARFDKGLISPYFINDQSTQSTILNDPYIILVDRVISTNEQILSLLNSIGTGKDILIIADMVQSVALGTLAANAQQKIANIACVCNPYTGSRARDFLFDMAALTGATVISEEMGMKLDTCTKEVCGRAEKVIATRDNTTVIGGKSTNSLETRILGLQDEISNCTSEYAKKTLEERLAQLTGGIGVIRVGAYTDTEFNAKKYKFENAINATQAALQEGIVAGGGIALFKVASLIQEVIFRKSLNAPFNQMLKNAGMEGYAFSNDGEHGMDFKNKESVNMFDAGIIDPFKVVRLALESATAIASSLVSIETVIVNEPEDVKKQ
jgi:chaperonin GroEL